MHVRLSMCRGLRVVDDHADDLIGVVTGVFAHPDLGKVEGLFVRTENGEEFLGVQDIAHWGRMIVVRDPDVLSHLEERVRLQGLWEEGRTIIGQRIVTESGVAIGTCADVQFETDTFRLEWLFPRKWFRWKRPIPAGAIVEVRPDAVCVRDGEVPVAVDKADAAVKDIVDAAMGASTPV